MACGREALKKMDRERNWINDATGRPYRKINVEEVMDQMALGAGLVKWA